MVERTKHVTVTAESDDAGARADVVLGRHVVGLSRKAAKAMALQGRLRVNDHAVPPSTRVDPGDRIELRWTVSPDEQSPPPLRILSVTDDILYVDKPSGLHTHRLRPDDPPALADAVAAVHPECAAASDDPREGGAVHRLDHETSGVVAFARSREAWTHAHRAIRNWGACKLYVALCEGRPTLLEGLDTEAHPSISLPPPLSTISPEPFRIEAPIGRGSGRGLCRVRPDGLFAKTLVWLLEPSPSSAEPPQRLYLLRLLTGRRHQARVHLAHVGLPIVGDALYGAVPGPRLGLHALRLDLSSVLRGQTRVDAPLPTQLLRSGGGVAAG